jgi:hypothetical protein
VFYIELNVYVMQLRDGAFAIVAADGTVSPRSDSSYVNAGHRQHVIYIHIEDALTWPCRRLELCDPEREHHFGVRMRIVIWRERNRVVQPPFFGSSGSPQSLVELAAGPCCQRCRSIAPTPQLASNVEPVATTCEMLVEDDRRPISSACVRRTCPLRK